MRTLVLGDLHISNKNASLREAQEKCLRKIYDKEKPDEVIQLGDFLDFRKPSPEALLAAKSIIDYWKKKSNVIIIRGNHCASTKADDGVTALSVFDHPKVRVVTHTWFDHKTKRAFIPHYENEEEIIRTMQGCPPSYWLFGHFGYFGCLNSVGDHDFSINVNSFRNNSILGHIHRQVERTFLYEGQEKRLLILGTPYTTNFGESHKKNYYAIMEDQSLEMHEIKHGPRHLMIRNKDIPSNIKKINNKNYHTHLRVILEPGDPLEDLDKIKVGSLDIKYSAAFDEEVISDYVPRRDLFRLNEVVIEDYINSANSSIDKDKLMGGYNLLKYED